MWILWCVLILLIITVIYFWRWRKIILQKCSWDDIWSYIVIVFSSIFILSGIIEAILHGK